jgi:hypothetical protein
MEHATSLRYDPSKVSPLFTATMLPSTRDYSTALNLFPGNNAHEPWGKQGTFFASVLIYSKGRLITKIHTPHCTEKGNIRISIDEFIDRDACPEGGVMILEYHHANEIPVEAYSNHVHRETGSYYATNVIAFIGDQLAPVVHATQLENTLFWPGIICNDQVQTKVAVVNPYRQIFAFQVHLYLENGQRCQTEVLKLKPFAHHVYSVEDLFPEQIDALHELTGRNSLCIASQYKQISYGMLCDRKTGIVTTMDHFHNYCLY